MTFRRSFTNLSCVSFRCTAAFWVLCFILILSVSALETKYRHKHTCGYCFNSYLILSSRPGKKTICFKIPFYVLAKQKSQWLLRETSQNAEVWIERVHGEFRAGKRRKWHLWYMIVIFKAKSNKTSSGKFPSPPYLSRNYGFQAQLLAIWWQNRKTGWKTIEKMGK